MKAAQGRSVVGDATDSQEQSYRPTKSEIASLDAVIAARASRSPSLKVKSNEGSRTQPVQFTVDHPDDIIGAVDLMRAIGTTDQDFYNGLVSHLISASGDARPSEASVNFMLSVVKGIEPRDQIEAMLAGQMAAIHVAAMTMTRHLVQAQTLLQQDSAERALNKLTRTFAAQVETLKNYRSKGEQKMTVQHVHVAEGGRAIVGNVSATPVGDGARKKMEVQPHALGYAPGIEMPRPRRSGAGKDASRRPLETARCAGCTGPAAAPPKAIGTP